MRHAVPGTHVPWGCARPRVILLDRLQEGRGGGGGALQRGLQVGGLHLPRAHRLRRGRRRPGHGQRGPCRGPAGRREWPSASCSRRGDGADGLRVSCHESAGQCTHRQCRAHRQDGSGRQSHELWSEHSAGLRAWLGGWKAGHVCPWRDHGLRDSSASLRRAHRLRESGIATWQAHRLRESCFSAGRAHWLRWRIAGRALGRERRSHGALILADVGKGQLHHRLLGHILRQRRQGGLARQGRFKVLLESPQA
mmetsp:Transcript_50940/g.121870  ORF Transcript_50940/g.121870 Transcript_50940/m.121870 type:complete len:252 (+) Transcript_50940:1276-2031(+)